MKDRIIFNFSFHKLNGTETSMMLCEGVPFTVGLFRAENGMFRVESYIFKPGYGESSDNEWAYRDTEDYAKQWLIEKAIPKILAYYADILPDKR